MPPLPAVAVLCRGQGAQPPNLAQAPKFLIGSIVISLSRCCLPDDEGPGPQIFFPRTATAFPIASCRGRGAVCPSHPLATHSLQEFHSTLSHRPPWTCLLNSFRHPSRLCTVAIWLSGNALVSIRINCRCSLDWIIPTPSACRPNLAKLQRIQNVAAQIVACRQPNCPASLLLLNLHWVPINSELLRNSYTQL